MSSLPALTPIQFTLLTAQATPKRASTSAAIFVTLALTGSVQAVPADPWRVRDPPRCRNSRRPSAAGLRQQISHAVAAGDFDVRRLQHLAADVRFALGEHVGAADGAGQLDRSGDVGRVLHHLFFAGLRGRLWLRC